MAEGLTRYIRDAMRRPFEWGAHDCCLFPADWVLRVTGIDPAADWRGGYTDEEGARRLVEAAGGLPSLFARGMGPAIGLGAHVAVLDAPEGPTGGIVSGGMISVLTPDGVGSLNLNQCNLLWRC